MHYQPVAKVPRGQATWILAASQTRRRCVLQPNTLRRGNEARGQKTRAWTARLLPQAARAETKGCNGVWFC